MDSDRPKVVLVTGSREWDDTAAVRRALLEHGPGLLIHGLARGLDLCAHQAARRLGWPIETYPARWVADGKYKAGPMRNQRMVDRVVALREGPGPWDEVCLAFPGLESTGTYDAAARAEHAGIRVVWFPARDVSAALIERGLQQARRNTEGIRLRMAAGGSR